MAPPSLPVGSHLRCSSIGGSQSSSSQSAALANRIHEKRTELEHLKQLRDLSASLASQMEALQEKLATLSDGTEGQSSHGNPSSFGC